MSRTKNKNIFLGQTVWILCFLAFDCAAKREGCYVSLVLVILLLEELDPGLVARIVAGSHGLQVAKFSHVSLSRIHKTDEFTSHVRCSLSRSVFLPLKTRTEISITDVGRGSGRVLDAELLPHGGRSLKQKTCQFQTWDAELVGRRQKLPSAQRAWSPGPSPSRWPCEWPTRSQPWTSGCA